MHNNDGWYYKGRPDGIDTWAKNMVSATAEGFTAGNDLDVGWGAMNFQYHDGQREVSNVAGHLMGGAAIGGVGVMRSIGVYGNYLSAEAGYDIFINGNHSFDNYMTLSLFGYGKSMSYMTNGNNIANGINTIKTEAVTCSTGGTGLSCPH